MQPFSADDTIFERIYFAQYVLSCFDEIIWSLTKKELKEFLLGKWELNAALWFGEWNHGLRMHDD